MFCASVQSDFWLPGHFQRCALVFCLILLVNKRKEVYHLEFLHFISKNRSWMNTFNFNLQLRVIKWNIFLFHKWAFDSISTIIRWDSEGISKIFYVLPIKHLSLISLYFILLTKSVRRILNFAFLKFVDIFQVQYSLMICNFAGGVFSFNINWFYSFCTLLEFQSSDVERTIFN